MYSTETQLTVVDNKEKSYMAVVGNEQKLEHPTTVACKTWRDVEKINKYNLFFLAYHEIASRRLVDPLVAFKKVLQLELEAFLLADVLVDRL